jgi:hypothetical protein
VHAADAFNAWYFPPSHGSQKGIPSDACFFPAAQSLHVASPDVSVRFPWEHLVHLSTAELLEYWPDAHSVHVLAPASDPVFVIEPAGHGLQLPSALEPASAANFPTSHAMHDMLDAVEYLPTAHAVHVVAPESVSLFVIDPAAHALHAATLELVEYRPASHAVHVAAPAAPPAFVIEPAKQGRQKDWPVLDWYLVASQAIQFNSFLDG